MRPHWLGNTFPIFSHWVFVLDGIREEFSLSDFISTYLYTILSYDDDLCILFGQHQTLRLHSSSCTPIPLS